MVEFAPANLTHLLYDEAWLYCATLTYDNHYDWRLPTYHEELKLWNIIYHPSNNPNHARAWIQVHPTKLKMIEDLKRFIYPVRGSND